jgi:hypothetical protein
MGQEDPSNTRLVANPGNRKSAHVSPLEMLACKSHFNLNVKQFPVNAVIVSAWLKSTASWSD